MAHRPLVIAADGSCLGNPGPGGWCWAASDSCWRAGAHARTTNNLMELRAVFEALSVTPADRSLIIETDSEYVVNIFTKWVDGWRARGWRTADRKPVQNKPAIEEVLRVLEGRDVVWRHVRGHAGHKLNEIADMHARAAATALQRGREVDHGSGVDCLGMQLHWEGSS